MKTGNLVLGMDVDMSVPVSQCVACIQGKHHVDPFPKRAEDAAELVGDLTVSDIWGPANTVGPAQECYFYSFTDAKSCYSTIYFSHTKDGVLDCFRDYTALVETQTGNHLKRLQSNGGSEYVNAAFKAFCAGKGIVMEFTAPYSPV